MNFVILNKKTIETSNNINENHIIISISTPEDTLPKVIHNEYTKVAAYYQFDDLDKESYEFKEQFGRDVVLFSEDDAMDILETIKEYSEYTEIKTIVVHCDAGISRSSAIAAALCKYYYNQDNDWIFKKYYPNRFIYSKLSEVIINLDKKKIKMEKSNCLFCKNELIQCFQDDEDQLMNIENYNEENDFIYVYYFCKNCGFHSPYAIGETEEEALKKLETLYNNEYKKNFIYSIENNRR